MDISEEDEVDRGVAVEPVAYPATVLEVDLVEDVVLNDQPVMRNSWEALLQNEEVAKTMPTFQLMSL